jgi:hypothetical protein
MILQSEAPNIWAGIEFFLARHGFKLEETTASAGMLFSFRDGCPCRDCIGVRVHDLVKEINDRAPEAHAFVRYFFNDDDQRAEAAIGVRCKETSRWETGE